jgi:hypothetical protein
MVVASPQSSIIVSLYLADEGAGTSYTARCLHKDDADHEKHEERGIFKGPAIMIQQMDEVAQSLS